MTRTGHRNALEIKVKSAGKSRTQHSACWNVKDMTAPAKVSSQVKNPKDMRSWSESHSFLGAMLRKARLAPSRSVKGCCRLQLACSSCDWIGHE